MDKHSDQKHILLAFATRRPYRLIPDLPEDAKYDHIRGYWVVDGGSLLARSSDGVVIPTTKKCDQETGEDQKGE
jgi:hypothetical protein